MAQRRMFSPDIVESEEFLDMPHSSQSLYFHLGMRADDDGFVQPKTVMRTTGANSDDLKVLIGKRFLLPFQSGVVVIKHWLIHNMIRTDRYKETRFLKEKKQIYIKKNKVYTDNENKGISLATIGLQSGNQPAPQVRLGKVRLGKERESTPAQKSQSFFNRSEEYEKVRSELLKKIPENVVDEELSKFVLYWTEPNKSGTKVRWEQQSTFDVRRRLVTWLSRVKQSNSFTFNRGRGVA